jgi:transketolase
MSVNSLNNSQKRSPSSVRKKILEIIYNSQASHLGSSLSVVEILVGIYENVDLKKILAKREDRDRIILSKGHSAAALYTVMNAFGLISDATLATFYQNGSMLGGHAMHGVEYVEHSTGALGHGLSVAVGICIGMKSKGINSRVFAVAGDGELHEGSNWEALMLASSRKLDNLCLIVDNNCLSGIGCTNECCDLGDLNHKFEEFGLKVYVVDGHNKEEISSIIKISKKSGVPVAIVGNTIKGKGVSFMEAKNLWHYRPPNQEDFEKAMKELSKV